MRAIVLEGDGRVAVRDAPEPAPGPGEALVEVRIAGICGTDLQLARGYLGFSGIPGHEFVGTVSAVSSDADGVLLGARVTGEINIGCQECAACAQGLARHCRTRRVLGILNKDGAFAEKLTLPVGNLKVIPPSIADEQAVFIEPAAAAFEILDQIFIQPTQRVLVLGDGRLGLLAGQALATRGCAVTVEGRHETKLRLARELGLMTEVEGPEAPSQPYDIVVDATGSPGGLDAAVKKVRPRGTVVMKTTCAGPTSFEAWRAVVDEITLVGSRCGRFEPAMQALASGTVKVEAMISARFSLEQGAEAFAAAAEPRAVKVLIRVAR